MERGGGGLGVVGGRNFVGGQQQAAPGGDDNFGGKLFLGQVAV